MSSPKINELGCFAMVDFEPVVFKSLLGIENFHTPFAFVEVEIVEMVVSLMLEPVLEVVKGRTARGSDCASIYGLSHG
jgi:hypothetical protein